MEHRTIPALKPGELDQLLNRFLSGQHPLSEEQMHLKLKEYQKPRVGLFARGLQWMVTHPVTCLVVILLALAVFARAARFEAEKEQARRAEIRRDLALDEAHRVRRGMVLDAYVKSLVRQGILDRVRQRVEGKGE